MDIQEKASQITEVMKKTKEEWVATKPANPDIAIYLHFWRGDDLVITLQCPVDRDTATAAGEIGAMGFAADTMAITFESFHSSLGKSPLTGENWRPQEMQYVFEAEPRNATEHWVAECVTTTIHERGGDYALISHGYTIEDDQVVWTEEQMHVSSDNDDGHAAGVMFEYLQHAMANQTIEEKLREEGKTNPMTQFVTTLVDEPERRQFHTDMATLTALTERKLITTALIGAVPGSLREELLQERFKEDGTWKITQV